MQHAVLPAAAPLVPPRLCSSVTTGFNYHIYSIAHTVYKSVQSVKIVVYIVYIWFQAEAKRLYIGKD